MFIAGHGGHLAMPPSLASLTTSWAAPEAGTRRDGLRIALIAALYVAGFGLMLWSEVAIVPKVVFLLTWGVINFFWLAMLRRPVVSAARCRNSSSGSGWGVVK